nr:AbrB/MazE/SpoVT family DNA-binding domain-containing protein [Neorhizobium galegae]
MREALNLQPGDRMIYSLVDGEVVITPKNVNFNDLAGLLGNRRKGGRRSMRSMPLCWKPAVRMRSIRRMIKKRMRPHDRFWARHECRPAAHHR